MADESTPVKEPPSPEQPVVPSTQSDEMSSDKPFYTTWWFWAIVIAIGVVVVGVIIALGG